MSSEISDITSVLEEVRKFEPSEAFRKAAHINSMEEYKKLYNAYFDALIR